jgi:hypothetical protein
MMRNIIVKMQKINAMIALAMLQPLPPRGALWQGKGWSLRLRPSAMAAERRTPPTPYAPDITNVISPLGGCAW